MMHTSGSLSFIKVLGQVTDPYERQARLFPALIAISPFLVMIFALYQDQLSKFHTLVFVLLSGGGLFLLSELARRRGKMKEKSLWDSWGGAPSVQVLRYANDTFDDVSTSRYHSILSKKIGVKFPSPHENAAIRVRLIKFMHQPGTTCEMQQGIRGSLTYSSEIILATASGVMDMA